MAIPWNAKYVPSVCHQWYTYDVYRAPYLYVVPPKALLPSCIEVEWRFVNVCVFFFFAPLVLSFWNECAIQRALKTKEIVLVIRHSRPVLQQWREFRLIQSQSVSNVWAQHQNREVDFRRIVAYIRTSFFGVLCERSVYDSEILCGVYKSLFRGGWPFR